MALLKTVADEVVMKKFLDKEFILPIIESHKNSLSRQYVSIKRFDAEHIKLLSAQSYLVKYTLTIVTSDQSSFTLVLRGNRISNEAAAMWQYLYNESKKVSFDVVPTPLQYFEEENFMLYEELTGQTLRDFDDKPKPLKKIMPVIAKKLAWLHSLSVINTVGMHTEADENEYWQSVVDKINTHHPEKPDWLQDTLEEIHKRVLSNMETQTFTLCHNDFQASNIIYDVKKDHVGIIDFGNSTIFTPTQDVATHLVHMTVMTTKHLKPRVIEKLQKKFIKAYLKAAPKNVHEQVKKELPLYLARVAADIIATTAVALSHTKNPYRILIPKILLPVVREKIRLLKRGNLKLRDYIISISLK